MLITSVGLSYFIHATWKNSWRRFQEGLFIYVTLSRLQAILTKRYCFCFVCTHYYKRSLYTFVEKDDTLFSWRIHPIYQRAKQTFSPLFPRSNCGAALKISMMQAGPFSPLRTHSRRRAVVQQFAAGLSMIRLSVISSPRPLTRLNLSLSLDVNVQSLQVSRTTSSCTLRVSRLLLGASAQGQIRHPFLSPRIKN